MMMAPPPRLRLLCRMCTWLATLREDAAEEEGWENGATATAAGELSRSKPLNCAAPPCKPPPYIATATWAGEALRCNDGERERSSRPMTLLPEEGRTSELACRRPARLPWT